jgi:cytochrome P450
MKDDVWAVCMLLFVTGEETTVNTIGNGMSALLRHPEKMDHLRQNPLLIQSAVEELLRFDSPVQLTSRIAIENIQLSGKTILAGEKVSLCLGAANRDPMEFLDPDTLNLARMNNHHLAFGEGIHFCLGATLARAQSQLAINALIQNLPEMNMLPGKLERRENIVLRGLKSLPVTFKK